MKFRAIVVISLVSGHLNSEVVYKTIPGTPFKDVTEPVLIIEQNIIYKPIPGTNLKDITEPLMILDKDGIYPTIPGTSLRDYSATPQFIIE
jgi:hypothetical protein